LILVKRLARAFRAVSALASPLLRPSILALLCARAGILVRPRRWSTLLLLTLLWELVSEIFSLSEKSLFSFATPRLLTLRGESRLELLPSSQKSGVFYPISLSMILLAASAIFLLSETVKNAARAARIRRAGFFLRHRLARREDFQGLRQRQMQL
jgi:hypothetical protein